MQWKLLQAGSITSTLFARCLHVVCTLFVIRVSEDALFAIHDWALGISPVTSYSGVKEDIVYISPQNWWSRKWVKLAGATDFSLLMNTHCLHNMWNSTTFSKGTYSSPSQSVYQTCLTSDRHQYCVPMSSILLTNVFRSFVNSLLIPAIAESMSVGPGIDIMA